MSRRVQPDPQVDVRAGPSGCAQWRSRPHQAHTAPGNGLTAVGRLPILGRRPSPDVAGGGARDGGEGPSMKGLQITRPGHFEIVEVPAVDPLADEVVVEIKA